MSEKSNFWIIMVLLLTPLVAGLTAYFLPIYNAGKNSELTYAAMNAEGFRCPGQSAVNVENWGNDGYARFCTVDGLKQGDWEAWQDGFRNIEGRFAAGEEEGDWKVLDAEGRLLRTVTYHQGKVVQRYEHPPQD